MPLWAALCAAPAFAQQPAHCPPPVVLEPLPALPEGRTEMSAREGRIVEGREYVLEGDVLVRHGNRQLQADQARYDRETDRLETAGHVRLRQGPFVVTGEQGAMEVQAGKAWLDVVTYQLTAQDARGTAARLSVDGTVVTLERAAYTTCPLADPDWLLSAGRLTLYTERNLGRARNVVFRFKDIPLAYLPYLSFPLGERKSGLLAPEFNVSETSGNEVAIPYYWNIAPNRDATFTPRYLSERGTLGAAQFRYLFSDARGEAAAEVLPSDRRYGADRSYYSWQHTQQLMPRWHASVNYQHVSDADYFRDLGGDLHTASIPHLERHLSTTVQGNSWQFRGRVQDYQVLDPDVPNPFQRFPQLVWTASGGDQWELDWYSEAVAFAKARDVEAYRFDAHPTLRLPMRRLYGFLIPKVQVRYTGYSLVDGGGTSRTVPTFSADGGLFFERALGKGRQTLEPRLFYVFTPYEPQDDIPVFDTGLIDFNYTRMFQERRYAGPDRIGDSHRLTSAVTTRILDGDGQERLSASLGQVYYLKDQQVTLFAGEPRFQQGDYRVAGLLRGRISPALSSRAELQWFSGQSQPERANVQLEYARNRGSANLSYRFRRQQSEQLGAVGAMDLGRGWELAGGWLYSLQDDHNLERSLGVGYTNCCWSLQVFARQYINDIDGDLNTAVGLQFALKGLSSPGRTLKERVAPLL